MSLKQTRVRMGEHSAIVVGQADAEKKRDYEDSIMEIVFQTKGALR